MKNKYQWDLTKLYKNKREFFADMSRAGKMIKKFSRYRDTLKSAASIKKALADYYEIHRLVSRLHSFAAKSLDLNTKNSERIGQKQMVQKILTEFGEASAFLQPEILKLPAKKLQSFASDPFFKGYKMFFRDLIREKKYVLSEPEEVILAKTSFLQSASNNVYSGFVNGELKYHEATLADNSKVVVDHRQFNKLRQSVVRSDRKLAFDKYFGALHEYKNTFAALLSTTVEGNVFRAATKKYPSAVSEALFGANVPVKFYEGLVAKVNKRLPILHRYLKLKKIVLGIKDFSYHDLYAPLSGKVADSFSYDRAVEIVLQSLAPLGEEYQEEAKNTLDPAHGWVDVYPVDGKVSGAYMSGSAANPHAYILLNHLDDYHSVSTVAHELGHAMHSFYSNRTQSYAESRYALFAAEVASTCNENLLLEYLLQKETDRDKRIALLHESLETMRTTVFRQMLFAEFEFQIYEAAEKKVALTADYFNKLFLSLTRKYYGEKAGITRVDEIVGIEWANIPHFYYDFYVYQYVSGYLTGIELSERILRGEKGARDRYINKFLAAGGSKYPLEELKDAGVNLLDHQAFSLAFAKFEDRIQELEKLLK